MNTLSNDITKHIAYQNTNDINAICNDLFNTFNLNYFDYVRIYPDNSCLILLSDQKWYQHYFTNKYPLSGTIVTEGVHLWNNYAPEMVLKDHAQHFNHYNGITIYTKNKDCIEYFDLAASANNNSVVEFYLNNINLLNNFLFYFKEKAFKILEHAKRNRFTIPDTMCGRILKQNNHENFCQQIIASKKCLNFLNKDVIFTRREYECMSLLGQGKTMKSIAQTLNISVKTVEEYLTNAKNKAGCCSRSQFIKLFIDNFF